MKTLLTLLLFLCANMLTTAQILNLNFAQQNATASGNTIAYDNQGNTYVGGKDAQGAYIQKRDTLGGITWNNSLGTIDAQRSYFTVQSIVVDTATTHVYAAGMYADSSFTPATTSIFVQKLDFNGNVIWVKFFGGDFDDELHAIALDSQGNVYAAGSFLGTVDFDPNSGEQFLTSTGESDFFVQKLDANGDLVWVSHFGESYSDAAHDVAVNQNGEVYITGSMGKDNNLHTNIFFQKLDENGSSLWQKNIGSTSNEIAYGLTIDSNQDIYLTGFFEGTVDFDPDNNAGTLQAVGSSDIFISKYDDVGNFLWAKQNSGAGFENAVSITTDLSDYVYVAGKFDGSVDFDPGAAQLFLNSSGLQDIFIQKLNKNGNLIWVQQFGSTGQDAAADIAIDETGQIYAAGDFSGTVNFDPNGSLALTAIGSTDAFVLNLQDLNFILPTDFISFEDPNFKTALLNNVPQIDENADGEISYAEAKLAKRLRIANSSITSMKEIVFFEDLKVLRGQNNLITQIDLSQNLNLKTLDLDNNQLAQIDITQNINLEKIELAQNFLSTLDVSQNNLLISVKLHSNQIAGIDISQLPNLVSLDIRNNTLTAIDVSNNPLLKSLTIRQNQITSLNLSANPLLEVLLVQENALTALDVTNNTEITKIQAAINQISTIDLSKNTKLDFLNISRNSLSSIDISKNTDLTFLSLSRNALSSIDLSVATALVELNVARNNLTTIDASSCSLATINFSNNTNLTTVNLTNQPLDFSGPEQAVTLDSTPSLTTICVEGEFISLVKDLLIAAGQSSTVVSVDCGGVAPVFSDFFLVTPNPTSGIMNLVALDSTTTISEITILDTNGNIVQTYPATTLIFNLTTFSSATYILRLLTNKGILTTQIVKI